LKVEMLKTPDIWFISIPPGSYLFVKLFTRVRRGCYMDVAGLLNVCCRVVTILLHRQGYRFLFVCWRIRRADG